MQFIRIMSYLQDGRFTNCEHLYVGDNQVKAIERFLREYPEHKDCIVVADHYDSDSPENKEHFQICANCGCVHYW